MLIQNEYIREELSVFHINDRLKMYKPRWKGETRPEAAEKYESGIV